MQRPRFTTRGLFAMTALVAVALGCFRFVVANPETLAPAVAALGIFCLGAAIGVPFGRPFRYGFGLMGLIVLLALLFMPRVHS